MNFYVSIVNDTINYIEENIQERLSLKEISSKFCMSEFHFNRIFKIVAGKTLKQYILGRKLTLSLNRLKSSDESVINIAYDYGFEYPEVFSRAFKKQFGIPPSTYRKQKHDVNLVKEATIIERDIINYKGIPTLKGSFDYYKALDLKGMPVEVDENSEEFESLLKSTGETFFKESKKVSGLNHDKFYTVVSCNGKNNGEYTVFYGKEAKFYCDESKFISRIIPKGWYASFLYSGDMFDIREVFIDDLYRWIMIKEIELENNGVGMLNIYDKDYFNTGNVQILVPIKNPK
ncbi:MAG: AraC family transcriptional regulator [Firmicutes bacterium]|nr:AraC family transcriptional regulator [Bacillota bacterium]